MSPESIPRHWAAVIRDAEKIDPIIREALRPVFERLKQDTPDMAAAFSVAMICRALRMLRTANGADAEPYQMAACSVAMAAVKANPEHP